MTVALPAHVQQEVAYAADLLQRADKAISQELKHLRAAGVPLEHKELLDLDIAMSRVTCRLRVIEIEAGRAPA